jgi:hypothetical protein
VAIADELPRGVDTVDLPTDLIPAGAAAQQLGIKLPTLNGWIKRGLVRAWKRVGRLYVSAAEVQELYRPVLVTPHMETRMEQRRREKQTEETLARFGLSLNGRG